MHVRTNTHNKVVMVIILVETTYQAESERNTRGKGSPWVDPPDRFTCRNVTYAKELTSVYIYYTTVEWF